MSVFPGSISRFLATEFASRPGRLSDVLRIATLTVIVVTISETFQIPLPAYSAYIVFFASKEETASTTLTGIILTLSATIAILAAIAIYMISAGEPGLRIPLLALGAFLGLYFSRVSPLGPAAFATGFVMTISLTLIDVTPAFAPLPSTEILTRRVLWLWVVAMLPIGLVVVANLLTGRDPADLFRQDLVERLSAAGRLLTYETGRRDANTRSRIASFIQSGTLELLRHVKMSGIFQKKTHRQGAANQAFIARTHALLTLVDEWKRLNITDPHAIEASRACGLALLCIARSLEDDSENPAECTLPPVDKKLWKDDPRAALLIERLNGLITLFPNLMAKINTVIDAESTGIKTDQHKLKLLVDDAFSNPEHVQFALKTTLCIMIAYITYSMVDWPEIRTAMITCFFVTLGNIGETVHKMTLRITGALIGGAIGFATIIFIMPYMTSIFHLCLAIGVMSFFAAWIATSSERLSYAGMQIALAFFLCVLVGYGPTVDLALPRDRVVGVLLGNVIVLVVFSNIWPVKASTQAEGALAEAIEKLADIFRLGAFGASQSLSQSDALVFAFDHALAKTWRLLSFDPFEHTVGKEEFQREFDAGDVHSVQSLLGLAFILGSDGVIPSLSEEEGQPMGDEISVYRAGLGSWLSMLAQKVAAGVKPQSFAPIPDVAPVVAGFEEAATSQENGWFLAQADWYRELDERISSLDRLARNRLIPN